MFAEHHEAVISQKRYIIPLAVEHDGFDGGNFDVISCGWYSGHTFMETC